MKAGTATAPAPEVVAEPVKRKTYGQASWKAYNLSQTTEKAWFMALLGDLTSTVPEPSRKPGPGRPPVRLGDAAFAAVYKVWSGLSARRFTCDLEDAADKMPNELSGGMRRRVGIARALVGSPKIILYDEPTAGLDPITARTICELALKLRDLEEVSSIFVTHRLQDIEVLANEYVVRDDYGNLIFEHEGDRRDLGGAFNEGANLLVQGVGSSQGFELTRVLDECRQLREASGGGARFGDLNPGAIWGRGRQIVASAGQDENPSLGGLGGEGFDQRRFADTGLAADQHQASPVRRVRREERAQLLQ